MNYIRTLTAHLSAAALGLLLTSTALAAPPPNDNFADATDITGASGTINGSNVEATMEPGEYERLFASAASGIWYRWTAPGDGVAYFDTLGSNFDTYLLAAEGTSAAVLTVLDENDDIGHPIKTSSVRFPVTNGVTYHLRVSGFFGETGAATLNWVLVDSPTNDKIATPTTIADAMGTISGNNGGATLERDEDFAYNDDFSVWYRWTAPSTGSFQFDTFGSSVNTTLVFGRGTTFDDFQLIAMNDDASIVVDNTSRVRVAVTEGRSYLIRLAAYALGDHTLNWEPTPYVPNIISFASTTFSVAEADPAATITINRTLGTDSGSLNFVVSVTGGSATLNSDYLGFSFPVGFGPDQTTTTMGITILPDRDFEGQETVQLKLTDVDESVNFATSTATLFIEDDDPYIPLKARYAGLISPDITNNLTGSVAITTAGNGSYTGVLKLEGKTFRFKGAFTDTAVSTPTVKGVALKVTYADQGDTLQVTVGEGRDSVIASCLRVIYGKGAPYPTFEIPGQPAPAFTVRIPVIPVPVGDNPGGEGYLTASIDRLGKVKIRGALADGTKFSAAGPLAWSDYFPLYVPLYKQAGSFSAPLILDGSLGAKNVLSHWSKPANAAAKAFKDEIKLDIDVTVYPYTDSKSRRCIDLDATRGLAELTATKGGLPLTGLSEVFHLSEADVASVPLMSAVRLKMKFLPKTGEFSGSFINDGKTIKFSGAVFQGIKLGSGFFLTTSAGQTASGLVRFVPAL